jgi:uncharacterized membrane protein YbhN (UPF0104 family)
MLNASRALARTVDLKIGWNRIGIVISLLIVSAAAVTLYNLLHDIQFDKVVSALREKSLRTVVIACVFVAGGYVTLTFYDFFSLRTIGRTEVPYRIAALASFTSYSIGHNLGATTLTAGIVRYRIYSVWGLGILDVAKMGFVTGLTFWLGNAFVLGLCTAYAPEIAGGVTQLPSWANRSLALAALVVIAVYLIWLLPRPRVIGRSDWRITLPNARLTLVQIGIGVLDLGCGALAMYTLLPATPIDMIPVLVTFVISTLLGFLSHVPGSLGVFEASMLMGLPGVEKEQLLASLLLFRLLYFVIPLLFAALLLGARELYMAVRPA